MNVRVRSFVGPAVLVIGFAAAAGCGRTSPVSPTPAAAPDAALSPSTSSQSMARRSTGTAFPILNGTFQIANDSGDGIFGRYEGTAISSTGGVDRASLTLHIDGGTGQYAGASGTLDAVGVGAFTGEGTFTLYAKGDAIVNRKHVQLKIDLTGTSVVSCAASSQIAVTQTGTGSLKATGSVKNTGDVHATLTHEVGHTNCGS